MGGIKHTIPAEPMSIQEFPHVVIHDSWNFMKDKEVQ